MPTPTLIILSVLIMGFWSPSLKFVLNVRVCAYVCISSDQCLSIVGCGRCLVGESLSGWCVSMVTGVCDACSVETIRPVSCYHDPWIIRRNVWMVINMMVVWIVTRVRVDRGCRRRDDAHNCCLTLGWDGII